MAKSTKSQIQQAIDTRDMEVKAEDIISRVRTALLLGKDARSVFFSVLALRLDMRPDWTIPTANVDGKTMRYNPSFICALKDGKSFAKATGLVLHEVMHCALGHHTRLGAKEPRKWNRACDLAINGLLLADKIELPECGIFPGQGEYKHLKPGLSAEEYYRLLPDSESGEGDGDEDNDPSNFGGVKAPGSGSPAECAAAEADWKVAVIQAQNAAKGRGDLPAGMGRAIDEHVHPAVQWADVLRRFVNDRARNDYSWSSPNRRFVHMGLHLPSVRSEELGRIVIAIDTSGSIDQETLKQFAAEVKAILEPFACTAEIVWHDSVVAGVQHWATHDGPLELRPMGGGGTSHIPVFEHIDQGEPPRAVICLTDAYSVFPERHPDYPVLWAVMGHAKPPWGEVIELN